VLSKLLKKLETEGRIRKQKAGFVQMEALLKEAILDLEEAGNPEPYALCPMPSALCSLPSAIRIPQSAFRIWKALYTSGSVSSHEPVRSVSWVYG